MSVLTPAAAVAAEDRLFGVYLHVPFCRVRCGYCDFNTYTAPELRGVRQQDYPDQAIAEIAFAASALDAAGVPRREASTVFFGGGTPTLLSSANLVRMVAAIRNTFCLTAGAEVTTEANPDSVEREDVFRLRDGGFTRISFGMQSAVPHVLATLDRTHQPERIPLVVDWAHQAGLDVSLDLIYGTPGESLQDWDTTLDMALAQRPDHVSAYSLIVEPGTRLARQIGRGELSQPDDDVHADMYERADQRLSDAGYHWYEVSNWARGPEYRSRHNLGYWRGEDWWGVGPGAHSHIGGVRWWNLKHPAGYAARIDVGELPIAGREELDPEARTREHILLRARIREGLPLDLLSSRARTALAGLIADGLIDAPAALSGTVVLTLRGRLLADFVVRALVD